MAAESEVGPAPIRSNSVHPLHSWRCFKVGTGNRRPVGDFMDCWCGIQSEDTGKTVGPRLGSNNCGGPLASSQIPLLGLR